MRVGYFCRGADGIDSDRDEDEALQLNEPSYESQVKAIEDIFYKKLQKMYQ